MTYRDDYDISLEVKNKYRMIPFYVKKKQWKLLNMMIYLYKHGEKYGRIEITNNVTGVPFSGSAVNPHD